MYPINQPRSQGKIPVYSLLLILLFTLFSLFTLFTPFTSFSLSPSLSHAFSPQKERITDQASEKAKAVIEDGKEWAAEQKDAFFADKERADVLTRMIALLGFGGVTGFVLGFTVKKMVKIVIVVLGLFLLGVQGLAFAGFATIHWEKIKTTVWPFFENSTFRDQMLNFMTAQFPYAGGFGVGFFFGFRKG